jgi:hypothetical protein
MTNKTTKSRTTSKSISSRNSTQTSVDNGIKVIATAIKKKVSLSEASRTHKFGRNYVSDIKVRITDNFKKKAVSKEAYSTFKNLLKQYETLS